MVWTVMASDTRSSPLTADEQSAFEEDAVRLGLTAAGMGEYVWDLTRDVFVVSPRMSRITGLPVGPMPADGGAAIYRFIHPDDQDAVRTAIEEGRDTRQRYKARHRVIRPDDGRVIWLENAAIAVGEPGKPPTRIIGVVQDITARKREEDEREALVAELDHRVKNVLASVQSLAAQSARKTASLDAFLKTFAGRLEAMASAHTLLTATRWRGAEIGNIAAAELGGLAPGQARWEGPEIILNPRATNALTLALHELATNAVKYGALSSETGRVEVAWRVHSQGGFELTWAERGGPSVEPPTRRGFGATLLERVTGRELGGKATLEFRRDGVRALLTADASALAAPRGSPRAVAPASVERSPEAHEGASAGDAAADDIRGVRVLIVEDAVLLALELESGLTEAGAKVVGTAASLAEAQKMLSLSFDVAVLDANLNGESVIPVAEALKARGSPFIIATGYGDAAAPEGVDAPVVRKPYNVHQIAAAMVQALGR
jgi:PAS domain S-box-containing protein